MRVAHDRQQAVEEQGGDGRTRADAEQGNHEDEHGQRRQGLQQAGHGQHDLAETRSARGKDAERQRHEQGQAKRDCDEGQVLASTLEDALPAFGRAACGDADPVRGDIGLLFAVDLHARIEPLHGRGIEAPGHALERGDPGRGALHEILAVEIDRFVDREKVPVVLEYAQAVVWDFGVGAVQIGGIERVAGEAAIGEVVVEAVGRLRQGIGLAQAGPAVGALHEFVAEAEAQLRMLAQVADRADTECARFILAHADRVGVIEAE